MRSSPSRRLRFAATASSSSNGGKGGAKVAFVDQGLLGDAKAHPSKNFRVIVQGEGKGKARKLVLGENGKIRRNLGIVYAVAANLTGRQVVRLAKDRRVTGLTLDAPMSGSLYKGDWFWPLNQNKWQGAVQVEKLYTGPDGSPAPKAPTIAIVDSGVASDDDFGGRLLTQINLDSRVTGESGDDFGHGMMVAGIAAGGSLVLPGAAPNADIVSLRTANGNNESLVSDVIAASQWVLANRSAYNIRVANFSLLASSPSSFVHDPLNKALEQLWFNGVVVVAASGNDGPRDMDYALANDPFIIVVGATDTGNSPDAGNDIVAPFSSYGRSHDGFVRPDVVAPGRYMLGPVPAQAKLRTLYPSTIVAGGYMRLSGTSFASPVVAGIAAQLLARHPDWTPDQVKAPSCRPRARSPPARI